MAGLAPAVVLVRPQMGENIGAAARAMANFGLSDLRLVAPRDGWPNEKADAMSAGGIGVVRAARVSPDLGGAAGDLTLVFAATARPRDMETPAMTPREAMARARAEIASGGRPGFLFGAEASGLTNEETALADVILTIPVSPDCPSLNLAQAVVVTAYEWLAAGPAPEAFAPAAPPAEKADMLGLVEQLEAALDDAGYFFPPERADSMRLRLRAAFTRSGFTTQEVRTLRGVIKALERRRTGAP